MTIATTQTPRVSLDLVGRTLRRIAIAATVIVGGIVYVEPSPHEFVALVAIVVCFGTGLKLHPLTWPMVFLLLAYIGFGAIAATNTVPLSDGLMWMSVSAFLAGTAILYASFVAESPEAHFRLIGWAYVAAAMVPALTGIMGYFGVAGADLFVLYGRARGTFQDQNVLGPFLVLPFLFLADGMMRGGWRAIPFRALLIAPITLAILLSFSRGAWGHLLASCGLLGFFTFALSRSIFMRLRVMIVIACGIVFLAAGLAGALSVPKVQELFAKRAQFTQSYDVGHEGRFGRWSRGFALALEEPAGIGPLQFAKRFPEDPHNVYLNALMAFGWGGALAYITFVVTTVAMGFRCVLTPTPWQRYSIVAFSSFLPLALLGLIIDTDHWRHFFLVAGSMWGLIAATEAWLRRAGRTLGRI